MLVLPPVTVQDLHLLFALEMFFHRFHGFFIVKGRLSKKNLQTLHEFTEKIIHQKIEERSHKDFVREYKLEDDDGLSEANKHSNVYFVGSSGKRLAFMDLLVDHYLDQDKYPAEQKLSTSDIREEVDTFMFEGKFFCVTNVFSTLSVDR